MDKRRQDENRHFTRPRPGPVQSDVWAAQYTDESGKVKRVSTKCTDKAAANKILVKLENEVTQIRAGVLTRDELDQISATTKSISDYVDQYETRMVSIGNTPDYITQAKKRIEAIFEACSIRTLADFTQKSIEQWIADELNKKELDPAKRKKGTPRIVKRTPGTINTYLNTLKGFVTWCIDNKHLTHNPLAKIKNLNAAIGRKKDRRSFTEEELWKLFEAARMRRYTGPNKSEEHVLVYRLLAGTGLRSMELGTATLDQFDFERCRYRIKAEKTKNKKEGYLPIRADLIAALKDWADRHKIQIGERIFKYTKKSIHKALLTDLRAAGIARLGADCRSLDVHSLRRTFGTMLARAGVPLTTTQRLMRHSTPEPTAKLYIDVEPIDMLQAVDKLPRF